MACFGLAAAAMVAMVSVRRNGDLKKEKGKVMVGTKNRGKIDALTTTLKRWRYGEDAEVRGEGTEWCESSALRNRGDQGWSDESSQACVRFL